MRSILGLAASGSAAVAAAISRLDGDADLLPFFAGLTLAAAIVAWAARPPFAGPRRTIARGIALAWLGAASWIAFLLAGAATVWSSRPPPAPETTYLGLTATTYHLVATYGGAILVLLAAYGPERWLERPRPGAARSTRARG